MPVFRQVADQLRETLAAMPVQSRVIAGLLVIAIGLSLAFLFQGRSDRNTDYLFGGKSLSEQELDEIELALSRAGLNDWSREGRRVRVPSESRQLYYAALDESASLPMSLRTNVQMAIDAGNPLESNEQRLAREMAAKEKDLSAKIAAFPDIRWASVEYDRGERRGLTATRPQSASVMVTPEGIEPLSRARLQMIKELIRGSYAGMSSDDVVVIDANSTGSMAEFDDEDPLLRKRREAEQMIETKVKRMLVAFEPVRVAAYADIDPTLGLEKTVLKYDAERTTTNESSRKIETTSNRPVNQGVPGVVPNAIGNRPSSLETDAETNRSKEEERESNGVVGQQYEVSRTASLAVKRIRVSVGLPSSYYRRIWPEYYARKNPTGNLTEIPPMQAADLQELKEQTEKNIKMAVTPVLPEVNAGADPFPLVEVWEYFDASEPETATSPAANVALTWLADSWQAIFLAMLALVALLIARSAIGTPSAPPQDFNEGFGLELPAPPPPDSETEEENEGMTITGGSLKEELVRLVERNPEVAANVIRSWVGDAA